MRLLLLCLALLLSGCGANSTAADAVTTETVSHKTGQLSVPLKPGWNAVAFQGLKVESVQGATGMAYYEGESYHAIPVGPVEGTGAYWVYADQAGDLTYVADGEATELLLRTGWNLVSSATTRSVPSSLPAVRAADGASTTTLEPGVAYWIYAQSETTMSYARQTLTPLTATIQVTGTQVFTLEGATWSSDPSEIATIDAQGIATGVSPGTATIIATMNGQEFKASLTVTPVPTNPAPAPVITPTPPAPVTLRTVESFADLRDVAGPVVVGYGAIKLNNQAVQATNNSLQGVATDGTSYVAVGDDARILTSPDGETWTERASPTTVSLYGVTWAGSQWVVAGDGGTVLTSPDGVTWTPRNTGTGENFKQIRCVNGLYVASGGLTTYTSPDSITWTPRMSGFQMYGVAYGNGLYLAGGFGGYTYTSPDGVTWTFRDWGTSQDIRDLTWTGSLFVAVGQSGAVRTSPDGLNWTEQNSTTGNQLYGVNWDGTLLRAVGDQGVMITSSDGVTWARAYSPQPTLLGLATDGATYVAVGQNEGLRISPDGVTWTTIVPPLFVNYTGVTYGGGQFVAVSDLGGVYSSPDGVTWVIRRNPALNSRTLRAVTYGAGTWVAVGDRGEIVTSTDLTSFNRPGSGTTQVLNSVAYGPSGFVTVDAVGRVITSRDGTSWTTSTTLSQSNRVAYANALYLVGGSTGALSTSTDLVTWTSRVSGLTDQFRAAAYGSQGWVLVGDRGRAASSLDGITWRPVTLNVGRNYLASIVASAAGYVAVGESGTIVVSP